MSIREIAKKAKEMHRMVFVRVATFTDTDLCYAGYVTKIDKGHIMVKQDWCSGTWLDIATILEIGADLTEH